MEEYELELRQNILLAAETTIPKSTGRSKRKAVPWWEDKCGEAVKTEIELQEY